MCTNYRYDNPNYIFSILHEKQVIFILTFAPTQTVTLMDKIVKFNNVDQYNSLYGLETLHPLVSVVDLTKATRKTGNIEMHYGVYALFLKQSTSCTIKYGRKNYDYQEGTIVSFAPNQVVSVEATDEEIAPKVYGLVFHPDLIRGTSLGKTIRNYTFFSYSAHEALHLSEQEKGIVMDCLEKISLELQHAIDKHSRLLIAMNIELLLNYCMRFYERQFITREKENKDALTTFENLLNDYFDSKLPAQEGLPTVKYFADKICLSPNYLGDMVKKETGRTPQEHIQKKVIELAKENMAETNQTVSQIAYLLGFQYPQHFCRLFKKHVGCTPNEYRQQSNYSV